MFAKRVSIAQVMPARLGLGTGACRGLRHVQPRWQVYAGRSLLVGRAAAGKAPIAGPGEEPVDF